ncbi:MAG: UV DNA damage endonuclease [Halovenus sp.]|jgi:UV DNA damage endonuclease
MLGYPCMNRTLRDREEPLRCNRGMQKATFEERGPAYAADLARQNLRDLRTILEWNNEHGIGFYRVTSTLVPWNSQFDLAELETYDELARLAARCGDYVREHGMRLTFHPDYWCRLASSSRDTVERSLRAVEYHADWLDLMGLARSPYFGINVHIGATYGDRAATAERFRDAVCELSSGARARLTVENDDEAGLWAVTELVEQVSDRVGVPVVFDYHHHSFSDRGLSYREGFERAAESWDCRPAVHYSEPARLHGADTKPQAHAEYVAGVPGWLRDRADVMVEAGAKERALLRLKDRAATAAEH